MNKNKKSVVFSMQTKQHFKIIVVGNKHAGKTSLILRFVKDIFEFNYKVTIGVQFYSKIIQDEGEQIALQIWDTAGSENYKSVVRSFYNFAHAVLIVYEAAKETPSIAQWMKEVRQHAQESVVVVLVRTKIDENAVQSQEEDEINKIMKQNQIDIFMTVSSKANINVSQLFMKVGSRLNHLLKTDEKFIDMVNHKCESILLQDTDSPISSPKNNKCCQ